MSRSYYDWMRAKRNFFSSQATRIASIPKPSDAVVYERESTNPYWQHYRELYLDRIPTALNLNFPAERIQQFITQAAQFEYNKEEEFLSKFYRSNNSNESHIEKFNNLFQSREMYIKFNDRIQNILNSKQYQKNKDQSANEYYTGMAPNLSSVFITYFDKHFQTQLYEFYKNFSVETPDTKILDDFDNIIRKAILEASREMAQISLERANEYGSGDEWAPIYDMLQNNSRSMELFLGTLKEAIGTINFNDLLEELKSQKRTAKRVSKKRISDATYQKLANIKGRKASIGGSILEPVIAMMANYFNGSNGSKDLSLSYKMLAENFGGNKVMSDVVQMWTTNVDVDLQPLMDELRAAMNAADSAHIREVYKKISDYYTQNDLEGKLDDLYTVFVNAKNYGIGANGRNYTKSYKGQFEELPSFLQANGIEVGRASEFLAFAYNTGEGAVRAGYRQDFMEECSNALKAMAANIMFDDYESVGHGGTTQIHMYYLSGKYIPASVVFQSMADSMNDAKATINLPKPITDSEKPHDKKAWNNIIGATNNDADFKEKLWKHWQQEYNDAKVASTWSVSFTLRIKKLVGLM